MLGPEWRIASVVIDMDGAKLYGEVAGEFFEGNS
jgi:hypothetical protein